MTRPTCKWWFDRSGGGPAAMYSLIVAAKLNDVALHAGRACVLRRIADHSVIAAGTRVTACPSTDPDGPNSGIRLPPWVFDGEALVWPGV